MEKVINLGIPHVGEQIFESIETRGLVKCLKVSETWKVLAENVLIKRWKLKMFVACNVNVVKQKLLNCFLNTLIVKKMVCTSKMKMDSLHSR